MSTSLRHELSKFTNLEVVWARKPNWKRVAISRHEFHLKSKVAVATARFTGGTEFPSTVFSSTRFTSIKPVVLATTSALRPTSGAPYDRSANIASSGCHPSVRARSSRSRSTAFVSAHTQAQIIDCMCLFEAV